MSKSKRAKFAAHPAVAALNPKIAPIVRLPSGQRFNRALYTQFFRNMVDQLDEFPELLINRFGNKAKEAVSEAIYQFPGDPHTRFMVEDQLFGFNPESILFEPGTRTFGTYSEEKPGKTWLNGFERFLLMLVVTPPRANQIVDAYDFGNCNPDIPERSFNKHDSLLRSAITHIATDFASRVHYFLKLDSIGLVATTAILRAQAMFTAHVQDPTERTPTRVGVN